MSLRHKVVLIIGAVIVVTLGLVYLVSHLIFINGLNDIEEQDTTKQVEQGKGIVTCMVNDLETDVSDWASWDDTYQFIQDGNQDYIQSNLLDDTFDTLMLQAMLFFDSSGSLIFGKAYDPDAGEEVPVSQELLDHFRTDSPLLSSPGTERTPSGLLKTENGTLIVAAQPILQSDGTGPVQGTLVFCRPVNDDTIGDLLNVVRFPIFIDPVDGITRTEETEAIEELQSGMRTVIIPESSSLVTGYTFVNDIYGKPSFLLRIESHRDIYILGQRVLSGHILVIVFVGLLVAGITWLIIKNRILSRISRLVQGINEISQTGDTSTRLGLTGSDEISLVAGTIDGMLGKLERVGKEIRESEIRYRLLADNVLDVIWSMDINLNITYVSPSITQLTGYTVDEIIGQNIEKMPSPSAFKEIRTLFEREVSRNGNITDNNAGLSSYEIQFPRKDRTRIWIELRVSSIKDADGEIIGFVGIARDITERRQAEVLYRTLANSSTVGVYIYQHGRFKFVNPRFQEMTGYSEEELLTMNTGEFVAPEDRMAARENAINMLKGKLKSPYEFRINRPNGEQRWAMETVSSIEYHGTPATLGNFMDITDSKVARDQLEKMYSEERKLSQSLEEEIQKRMDFTRALVHELKTPITPILAAVELLLEEIDNERLLRLVQSIDRSAANLNQRINELLDLARGETDNLRLDLEVLDPLPMLNEISYELIPVALRNNLVLEFNLPQSLNMILADRGRLRQVITNLLNNAFKFTDKGGKIILEASEDEENLIVKVIDNGPGIPEEDHTRLFEPYFRRATDRERLSGLGLGLALAKNFVELHGGRIWIESEPGKGSSFIFTIPLNNDNISENDIIVSDIER